MKERLSAVSGLLLLAICFVASALSQTNEKAIIDKFITKQVHEQEASEYKGARKVLRGDVNGDHKTDLVALYTLEGGVYQGGNYYTQYIVVFVRSGNSYRYAAHDSVGGKEVRDVSLRSVVGFRINLDTMEYTDSDGSCCPSRKAKTVLVLRNGKLVELGR